jgi:anti-anti-sigma regulatory factor
MSVTLLQDGETTLICFEGEVTISSAAELKGLLLKALATGKDILVSLEHGPILDVTAAQVLISAERAARASGLQFTMRGSGNQDVSADLREAGIEILDLGTKAVGAEV